MKIKAIIDQLKTGSVKNVFTKGNYEVYPSGEGVRDTREPYVLVYDGYSLNPFYGNDNTVRSYIVEVHYPPGNLYELDEYIEHEVIGLLAKKRLTDPDDGTVFQIYSTALVNAMQEPNDDRSISGGNDDKTISRMRTFIIPRRGA